MSYLTRFLMPNNYLQFFAEEGTGGGSEGGSGEGDWIDDYYSDRDKDKDSSKSDNMIPKSRFDSVNTKYKELTEASKVKQGEYDTLLQKVTDGEASAKTLQEAIDAGNTRVEALEVVIKSMLDTELEAIDEEYRELVPSDKPIEEQLDWLRKAKAKGLFGSKGFEFEIGQPSNPRSGSKSGKTEGMNAIQMLTMGYGTK